MKTGMILNVDDARRRARRVLPRVIFDYVEGGADDERGVHRNESAFEALTFVTRMASAAVNPDQSTTVLGQQLATPIILAPCGLVSLLHPDGAVGVARAAHRHGTISVLSTVAGEALEDVAGAAPGPIWFQLYSADRDQAGQLVDRAATAGIGSLVVTVDTPIPGNRERDRRHQVSPPLQITKRQAVRLSPQVLARPGWAGRMVLHAARRTQARRLADTRRVMSGKVSFWSPLTWHDLEWIRAKWPGSFLVKGVLTAADARRAVGIGADAVVVSNHGGRQLEGAPATLSALPAVADAVGREAVVLMDGGVRRGSDVAKALALGARAVLIGRPYLYGLAAAGQEGVEQVLGNLRTELGRTLTLMGCPDVAALGPHWVEPADAWLDRLAHREHESRAGGQPPTARP